MKLCCTRTVFPGSRNVPNVPDVPNVPNVPNNVPNIPGHLGQDGLLAEGYVAKISMLILAAYPEAWSTCILDEIDQFRKQPSVVGLKTRTGTSLVSLGKDELTSGGSLHETPRCCNNSIGCANRSCGPPKPGKLLLTGVRRCRRQSAGVRRVPTGPWSCLLYTSPSPRDQRGSRMPSSA